VPFLQLTNVSKSYAGAKGRTRVLKNVSLAIEENEFLAVLGFSGSGKTTLISLMAGLIEPDSGEVTMKGERIRGPSRERGLVFQNYSLLPWLSAYENVALAVDQVYAEWPKSRRREHVVRYLELVNLGHALNKKPRELSGGMRQRVSVARALAMNPEVLLLDEPLSALDALTRASLQDEIERIRAQENKTIVLVTNDVDEGLLLADRIVPLTPGPDATLGTSFPITLKRPRDRRALNHDPEFKRIRNQVIKYLTGLRRAAGPGGSPAPEMSALPDSVPAEEAVY
jgi:nitrate/nitrite transport system ATP-binding protein